MPELILLYAVPVLIMAVSLPLIMKMIPKNSLYGFRTPRTMSGTNEYWYQANRRGGFVMFLAGVASFLAALILPLFVSGEKTIRSIWSFILLASVIVAVCFWWRREAKLDR